jgi:Rab GDP dissociation inhibitor
VTKYLEFKSVAGSFVVQSGKVHKVPSTPSEALSSGLLGMFQKRRFRTFLQFASNYEEKDAKTHDGLNLEKMTAKELFDYFKLEADTQQFTGHAIALQPDDAFMKRPAKEAVDLIKLYAYSVSRYGNSPYIYPVYGLGGLPEGFSRLAAIHGGTYMLNHPISELVYGEDGKVIGVKDTEGVTAKTKMVICDPSYVLNTPKVKQIGRILRAICVLSHPIPGTNDTESNQIIIPYQYVDRFTRYVTSCPC